ncbi:hypothetical protein GCM10010260_14070 [Streptomyces filipinensis]|uniref:Uncharacterized protein n=1 Tax=Streptomyces filipinensis TaxID=66887 RepID=A0A918I7F7_9ACTN|nr:hypothetical protein GCM10010260_14070 [Streptomyces filipinensis]
MVTHDSASANKAPRLATIRAGRIAVKANAGARPLPTPLADTELRGVEPSDHPPAYCVARDGVRMYGATPGRANGEFARYSVSRGRTCADK